MHRIIKLSNIEYRISSLHPDYIVFGYPIGYALGNYPDIGYFSGNPAGYLENGFQKRAAKEKYRYQLNSIEKNKILHLMTQINIKFQPDIYNNIRIVKKC